MTPKLILSAYDIIGFIADVQTTYTENYKTLESKHHWTGLDARLQVFFQCADVAGNARLSIALITFARANGLNTKEWWGTWACYDSERAFNRWPDFQVFIDDKSRQYSHRVQEQLVVTIQIYVESFLRLLGRQFNIDRKEFWRLKNDFLESVLDFSDTDLVPLAVYQHLRNSLHNKGLHHNANYPDLTFDVGGYRFDFNHGHIVRISWEHLTALLIATSNLLLRICENPKVVSLPSFDTQNIVVLTDDD